MWRIFYFLWLILFKGLTFQFLPYYVVGILFIVKNKTSKNSVHRFKKTRQSNSGWRNEFIAKYCNISWNDFMCGLITLWKITPSDEGNSQQLFRCYISALVLTCFRLKKGRATFFRPEIIVASFLHLMMFFFKVLLNHFWR